MEKRRIGENRFYLLLLICLLQMTASAQKNDTVYMINGDRITGELRKFERGTLLLKTDGFGTINIEYDKINTLYSAKSFEVVGSDGKRLLGTISKSKERISFDVATENDTITRPISEIAKITLINKQFWRKFYGSFDIGLNYNKSSDILQFNLGGDLNFRAKKDLIGLKLNSIISTRVLADSAENTRKQDAALMYTRFISGKWGLGTGVKVQQNFELDLNYRLQLGLLTRYDIIYTNPVNFYLMTGLILNKEKALDSSTTSSNMEADVSLMFSWIRYRHPKINILTGIDAFPGLTTWGRIRLEYELSISYEIFRNFYIKLSFYDNYDNRPSGGGSALNDFGGLISLGYSFN